MLSRKETIKLFVEHKDLRKREVEIKEDIKNLVSKLCKDYSNDYYPIISIETFNRLLIKFNNDGVLDFGLVESLANYFEVTPTIHTNYNNAQVFLMFDFQENRRF